jgi:hypothetical protein
MRWSRQARVIVWLAASNLVKVLIVTLISMMMKDIEGGTRPLQAVD